MKDFKNLILWKKNNFNEKNFQNENIFFKLFQNSN